MKKKVILCIFGPTATGKSYLAIHLSNYLPIEIISVDSVLIYRDMNIGTSKPSLKNLSKVKHHLIDIKNPEENYSVVSFINDVLPIISDILNKGRIPVLVGGTMMYFKYLLQGIPPSLPPPNLYIRNNIIQKAKKIGWTNIYNKLKIIDPISANRIHPNDTFRLTRALEVFLISGKTLTTLIQTSKKKIHHHVYQFSIMPKSRNILHKNIEERFYKMLSNNFEQEVINLFNKGTINKNTLSMQSIGYKQMWSYLSGNISYKEMIYRSICATRQLAKKQITWLKQWENTYLLDSEKKLINISSILKTINKQ